MEKKSFVQACNSFFGRKSGQMLSEFARELRELTPEDKGDLVMEFAKGGIEVVEPTTGLK